MTNTKTHAWEDRIAADRKRLAALRADMAAGNGTEVEIAHRNGFGTQRDFDAKVAVARAAYVARNRA